MNLTSIIQEAKTFVKGWDFVEIDEMYTTESDDDKENGGATWTINKGDKEGKAHIRIGAEADIESLYHEVFHSVFHNSPLNQGEDKRWGEAWCDAFRYFYDGAFKRKIDAYAELSLVEAKAHGDWNHDRLYAYPCSLIVKKCSKEYGKLRELWFEICGKREDVIGGVAGYEIGG